MELRVFFLIGLLALLFSCGETKNECVYDIDLVQVDSNAPYEFNVYSSAEVIWSRQSAGVYVGTTDCEFSNVIVSPTLPKDDSVNVYISGQDLVINTYRWNNQIGGYFLSDNVLDNRITCN
jgi:hypothetical protein